MIEALRRHWPEYLIEAALLGLFMISACVFGVLLAHPASPLVAAIPSTALRRGLTGVTMGATAAALIYSPWGRRSGAHFNPSVTLTFLRLGKIAPVDALFYVTAQFLGGVAGVALAALALGGRLGHPAVDYVSTLPGSDGAAAAFAAEAGISFFLMWVILVLSNLPVTAAWTGAAAAALVALYVAFESPISGMSMNPARSFGSFVPAGHWGVFWIYVIAPVAGMLLAAEAYRAGRRARRVRCAKLHHADNARCIFHCEFGGMSKETA